MSATTTVLCGRITPVAARAALQLMYLVDSSTSEKEQEDGGVVAESDNAAEPCTSTHDAPGSELPYQRLKQMLMTFRFVVSF